jgi:transcriptional regulator with XRE-family HTH domain
LIKRLKRGSATRAKFVESHVSKTLAFQIRSLREKEEWSQQSLAEKIGSNQNAVYRAENPSYGKQTLTTLKKIAAAFDVALAVRFVPFSELVDWVSETPRTIEGLTPSALAVASFSAEEKAGLFAAQAPTVDLKVSAGAAESARTSINLTAGSPDPLGRSNDLPALDATIARPWMRQVGGSAGAMQAAGLP